MSPSRRYFADLPEDTTAIEPSRPPPQSRFLAGPPLLTLPGAEPDNSLSTDFYCVAYTGSTAIIRVRLVAFQVEQYLAYDFTRFAAQTEPWASCRQKVLRDSVYMRRYRCGWKKPFLWEFTLYLNLCWNVMALLEEMPDVEGKEDWGGARGRQPSSSVP
ncbi:hypothetical protein BGW80DRAFT_1253190 [Lactifluus volemus]|nr:hypothetical protein BGW80DRAFT_1253190 [Lactifluus volemus]